MKCLFCEEEVEKIDEDSGFCFECLSECEDTLFIEPFPDFPSYFEEDEISEYDITQAGDLD